MDNLFSGSAHSQQLQAKGSQKAQQGTTQGGKGRCGKALKNQQIQADSQNDCQQKIAQGRNTSGNDFLTAWQNRR